MNIKGILVAASLTALGASTAACGAGTANGVEMLPSAFDGKTPVVVETDAFKLVINPDATARSLVIKATGEECLAPDTGLPVFAATQKRPFNNETRLVQLAKRTSYPANRIRRDGNLLRIGFETAPYEAEVRVVEKAGAVAVEVGNNTAVESVGCDGRLEVDMGDETLPVVEQTADLPTGGEDDGTI